MEKQVQKKRSGAWFILLGVIQFFVAFGAIPAGLLMVIAPDGSLMGMSTATLGSFPFSTYLIPGLFLLIINGLGQVAAGIISIARKKYAGRLGIVFGLLLLIWILAQVYWIGFVHFLQPVMFIAGCSELALGWILFRRSRITP